MNKLLTKVVGIALGMSMAIGAGVAAGVSGQRDAMPAFAAGGETLTGGGSNTAVTVNYNSTDFSGIKIGASKNTGSASFGVPIGASSCSFYAAGWSGKSVVLAVSVSSGTITPSTESITSHSSVSGTGTTYTITGTDNDYKHSFTLNNVSTAATVTITTDSTSGDNRAAIWNANYEASGGGQSESTIDIDFVPGTDTGATSVTKLGVTATMTAMSNASYYQIYANESGTFSSSVGNIKKIVFTCTASGTSKYGPGNASANVGTYSYSGSTGTWTGDASSVTISSTAQIRMSSLTITRVSSGTIAPTQIACSSQSVNVSESITLANQVAFTPADTTETGLSFSVKSGAANIDFDSSTSKITGKKSGSAVITVTPTDTSAGAEAIDVSITINALAAPGITVGDDYVIHSHDETNGNYELSGLASDHGNATSFTGDVPASTFVFSTESGYYENTVAFKNGSSYLSLDSDGANLNSKSTIDAHSSWIVLWNSSTEEATVKHAIYQNREIRFNYNGGNVKFACYANNGSQTPIKLHHYVVSSLVDFTIEATKDVYKSGTAQIAVTYNPADASDKTLSWNVTNADPTGCVTVDQDGTVHGVEVGTATVTASKTIGNQNVVRSCTVTVLNNTAAHEGTKSDPFDVNDAKEVAMGVFTKVKSGASVDLANTQYYVKGLITNSGTKTKSNLTFFIGDDLSQTNTANGGFEIFKAATVYGTALADEYATDNAVKEDFAIGHIVLVHSKFTCYQNTTPETVQGDADIAWCDYYEARKFAENSFNDNLSGVCDVENGQTNLEYLQLAWALIADDYGDLDPEAQLLYKNGTGSSAQNATTVAKAIYVYDYITEKYGHNLESDDLDDFDFMDRGIQPQSSASLLNGVTTSDPTVIITIIAVLTLTATGGYFFLRKRKEN